MAAAAIALVIANSPISESWFPLLHLKLGPLSLAHWVNDGMMALFFLLVGLEIKREMLDGQLSSWDRSEEHTSELQSLMRISYAVICLKQTIYIAYKTVACSNTCKHSIFTYSNTSTQRITA